MSNSIPMYDAFEVTGAGKVTLEMLDGSTLVVEVCPMGGCWSVYLIAFRRLIKADLDGGEFFAIARPVG
jgi:hypothetical protein